MKQTLFAWLASIFSSKRNGGGSASATGGNSYARGGDSGDGDPGQIIITDKNGVVVFDGWNTEANPGPTTVVEPAKPKTQAELDFELLKTKFNPHRDVAAISRERYDGLLYLSFENEEVDSWMDRMYNQTMRPFIFIDGIKGIGIVSC